MPYHLTQPERTTLSVMLRLGYNQRQIADEIGVHPSTICRELRRGAQAATGCYHARVARPRASAVRLAANQRLRKYVSDPNDSIFHAYYEKPAIRADLPTHFTTLDKLTDGEEQKIWQLYVSYLDEKPISLKVLSRANGTAPH